MDVVLGVSIEPTVDRAKVRLVLVEGCNADGVTVEQDIFEVAATEHSALGERVIAAIIGTREGAAEGGCQLTSAGVTWTDPAEVAALRDMLGTHDVGGVMLVSPLLAAAALAQTVGQALGYQHIAMLFVEPENATLAVVDVGDGSIVDLQWQSVNSVRQGVVAARLAAMVAGLDAPGSRADGVFLITCGVDFAEIAAGIKPVLEAATALDVIVPEEPDMALARGAALASANAPLFASSTAALAYALDPGTGELNPRALSPSYLDVCAHAGMGRGALAYSALDDEDDENLGRRRPVTSAGRVLAGICAIAVGLLVVSLTSDVRPMAAPRPSPRSSVLSQARPPAASSVPPALPVEAAAPPPPSQSPPVVQQPPHTVVNMAPAMPTRRVPVRRAPESVPTPVHEVEPPAAPVTTPPAAVPEPPAQAVRPTPAPLTMYLHFPFVTIPIPITPPPPPMPPPETVPAP